MRCQTSSHDIILRRSLLKKSLPTWLFYKVFKSCKIFRKISDNLQGHLIIVIYQFSYFSFFENNLFLISRSDCLYIVKRLNKLDFFLKKSCVIFNGRWHEQCSRVGFKISFPGLFAVANMFSPLKVGFGRIDISITCLWCAYIPDNQ